MPWCVRGEGADKGGTGGGGGTRVGQGVEGSAACGAPLHPPAALPLHRTRRRRWHHGMMSPTSLPAPQSARRSGQAVTLRGVLPAWLARPPAPPLWATGRVALPSLLSLFFFFFPGPGPVFLIFVWPACHGRKHQPSLPSPLSPPPSRHLRSTPPPQQYPRSHSLANLPRTPPSLPQRTPSAVPLPRQPVPLPSAPHAHHHPCSAYLHMYYINIQDTPAPAQQRARGWEESIQRRSETSRVPSGWPRTRRPGMPRGARARPPHVGRRRPAPRWGPAAASCWPVANAAGRPSSRRPRPDPTRLPVPTPRPPRPLARGTATYRIAGAWDPRRRWPPAYGGGGGGGVGGAPAEMIRITPTHTACMHGRRPLDRHGYEHSILG